MGKSLISSLLVLLSLTACRSHNSDCGLSGGDTITTTATLLTIVEFPDYTIADVANPWLPSTLLQRYILVDANTDRGKLPEGVVINIPLQSSLVYSSVHAGAIHEINRIDVVTAVCDAQYYKIPEIVAGLASGDIVDAGSSMSPSIERILAHEPQAILASPFQNAGHGAIEKTGIPIVECADYMETSPLGRAEWIKLLGRLYGNAAKADSIYNSVASSYHTLTSAVSKENRPTVISEMVTNGVWYMPGGASYMARLFSDAGAEYPWHDDKSSGSLQLDFATVYDKAHDADFWFVKTFGQDLTLAKLREAYPLHERMSAFSNGGIYACNTATSSLFEDFPFHPDLLLRDFINILHPGTLPDSTLQYYKQVK